jgi:hypothetical protein
LTRRHVHYIIVVTRVCFKSLKDAVLLDRLAD